MNKLWQDIRRIDDEAILARVANIIGDSSAAAQALAEAHRRRKAGESVVIFQAGETLVVGPAPTPSGKGGEQ